MHLDDICVVLSRPGEAGNIGAVCRAMKNMGLSRLRLVLPQRGLPNPLDEEVILTRAVHAADVWERGEHFETLEEALSDCALAVGTTRRYGHKRSPLSMTPSELAGFLQRYGSPGASGMAAIVFGNERSGLDEAEMALCNIASHIPSSADFPSLNLSHAVQIYAYELYQAMGMKREQGLLLNKGAWIPLNQDRIRDLVQDISDSLSKIGFYRLDGREDQERFFKNLISRAGLSEGEGQYFTGLFSKAAGLAGKKVF